MAQLPLALGLVVFALAAALLGVVLGRHLPSGLATGSTTSSRAKSGSGAGPRAAKTRPVVHLAGGNAQAHAVLEAASDFLLVVDDSRRIVDVSSSAEHLLGFGVRTMLDADVVELLHPDDRTAAEGLVLADPDAAIAVVPLRFRRADGDWLDGDVLATRVTPTDQKRTGGSTVSSGTRVALGVRARPLARRRRGTPLGLVAETMSAAFDSAPRGMALAEPDGRVTRVNAAMAVLLGHDVDDLVGVRLKDLTHPDDWYRLGVGMQQLRDGGVDLLHLEQRAPLVDGNHRWVAIGISAVRDVNGELKYLVCHFDDIHERKATIERMAHAAIHDPLTGLPNRLLFMDRLTVALERAQRDRRRVAVVFLDLDRFKFVNDSLGHAAGDQLLVEVAQNLRAALRTGDLAARFGGDEFVVLCTDVDDEEDARAVADRVAEAVSRPVTLGNNEVFVAASLGIALSGGSADTAETLLRDADTAMYRAKARALTAVEVFDHRSRARTVQRHRLGNDLHRALERHELHLHYQPIFELATTDLVGYEALLRWSHPTRGLLHPSEFVELAEENGLIAPIGAWVLEEACRATSGLRGSRGERVSVSVNLSPHQLQSTRFVRDVLEVLDKTGTEPDRVWLEITESVLLDEDEAALGALRTLRSEGLHVAIDDFGTGYSSLSYLPRLPVEALKVDRSFVSGLGSSASDTAIVAAVVHLGGALGLTVVAEGIETQAQLSALRAMGSQLGQGYLLGAPLPAEALEASARADALAEALPVAG